MKDKILEWFPEEDLLFADGFDDAIIGIEEATFRIIYSIDKCINILMERDGMSDEDATEFFNYNVSTAWVGEKTPIWCIDYL